MTLQSRTLAVVVVSILFGGIFFSSVMGWWQTESSKEAAVYTSGEYAGQANPADIRGSYTFGDVEKNFGIPAGVLAQAFNIQTDDAAAYPVKSLEEVYAGSTQEVGTSSVRLFVAFYLSLPFDLSSDIFLPEPAAAQLRTRSLSSEQAAYLEAHTLASAVAAPETVETTAAPQPETPSTPEAAPQSSEDSLVESEQLVKGKTSFAELLDWGVTDEALVTILGMPLPSAPGTTLKDFCSANGLDFESLKALLQAEVDRLK